MKSNTIYKFFVFCVCSRFSYIILSIAYTLLGVRAYITVWSGDTASDVTGPTVILNDSLSVSVLEVMVTEYYKISSIIIIIRVT